MVVDHYSRRALGFWISPGRLVMRPYVEDARLNKSDLYELLDLSMHCHEPLISESLLAGIGLGTMIRLKPLGVVAGMKSIGETRADQSASQALNLDHKPGRDHEHCR